MAREELDGLDHGLPEGYMFFKEPRPESDTHKDEELSRREGVLFQDSPVTIPHLGANNRFLRRDLNLQAQILYIRMI